MRPKIGKKIDQIGANKLTTSNRNYLKTFLEG
jgi:hypothetical protein